MRSKKYFIFNIFIALIIASSIALLSRTNVLKGIELSALDFLFRLRGSQSHYPPIVIIEVDDENISKIGRWPWERKWHAVLVTALKDLGAKEIYFDVLFSESSNDEDDALFAEAIKNAGNVYLPFVFREDSTDIDRALKPIPILSVDLKGTGAINIYPDIDGSLRRVPLFFNDKDRIFYHMALQLALDHLGAKVKEIGYEYLVLLRMGEHIKIPLVGENMMLVNWLGKWKETFTHYSFLEVLNAYNDVLENKMPPIDIRPFKNSICIVAVTAIGLYDIKPTPLEFVYPGIGVTATAIGNIINKAFISKPPVGINWMLIYILGLLPALLISGERSLREVLIIFSVATIFFATVYSIFKTGLWIDFGLPLLALFGSYFAVASYNFVRVSIERKSYLKLAVTDELTGLFNIRYFMMIIINEIVMAKHDPTKKFCLIMADVDHFKEFNDNYGHQIGDFILSKVADILKISVRSSDVAARYGGEEMILLLRGTDLEGGMVVAEKIRKNVEDFIFKDKDFVYRVTLSVGVARFHYEDDESTIIKRADDSMYEAKRRGRNSVATTERTATEQDKH